MKPSSLQLRCPAKINLALSVGAPDEAHARMHPIASWMVALDWGDDLQMVRLAEGEASRFDLSFAADAPKVQPIDWPLEKDLAFRAHALMEQRTGRALPMDLKLVKRVPAGGGLGGGSSDAAGTLWGINRLFDLGVSTATLVDWSRALGSDIAFFLRAMEGTNSALVTGFGEQWEPAARSTRLNVVLFFPPVGCPTGPVYRAFDAIHSGDPGRQVEVERVRSLALSQVVRSEDLFNDLAEPAYQVQPALEGLRSLLAGRLGKPIHVTGSGSTLFALAGSEGEASGMAATAGRATGLPTLPTMAG